MTSERKRLSNRLWSGRNRDKRRGYKLKYQYGLTLEQYAELLEEQDGVCAICARSPGKRPLTVDHNHETGKVRGLLCDRCNLSVAVVESSMKGKYEAYLVEHGQPGG